MKSWKRQFCLTGIAACICLLMFVTTTYGAEVVIGGDYIDVGRIVFVSPKAGDTPTANGTALLNALASIPADADNPYLIKLGPGSYDLGAAGLQMKEYVYIEGSGEKATKITAAVSHASNGYTVATVMGANNAELRSMTVENMGTGSYTTAIMNSNASPTLIHVTATASGATSFNYGFYNYNSSPIMTNVTATASGGQVTTGVYNDSSSPIMTNVTATASGGTSSNFGIRNVFSSSPVMTNVAATGSGGTESYGAFFYAISGSYTILMDRCSFTGDTTSIKNDTEFTLRIGASKLDGPPIDDTLGSWTCAGSYNGNYETLGANCLVLAP